MHYVERLPVRAGLGRHVNHDPRNLLYRHGAGRELRQPQDVKHMRTVPAFDQGQTGSCTGNAMEGLLATAPFFDPARTYDEAGAVKLYSAATALDPYPGTYPPTDTGSDGTSVAQAAKNAGDISGFRTALGLAEALDALIDGPVITGVPWHDDSFNPDGDGRVHVTGALAGGHEVEVFGVDVEARRVWCYNSWSPSWGVDGTFYWTWDDWTALLAQKGDVTVPIPLSQPAPTPTPVDVDQALALEAHRWLKHPHTSIAGNAEMRDAVKTWLKAKAL